MTREGNRMPITLSARNWDYLRQHHRMPADVVPVDITETARWFFEEDDTDYRDFREDFPCVVSSWPVAWFEFPAPSLLFIFRLRRDNRMKRLRRMTVRFSLLLVGLLLLAACGGAPAAAPATAGPARGDGMKISSPAFVEGALIPGRYTCDGEDISPPLQWTAAPPETATLALVADDPDAPLGTWVHWVVFDLPAATMGLPEGVPAQPALEGGGVQGVTSFRKVGYGGPCPPSGTHRYYFRLYALDTSMALSSNATAADLRAAMQGHVLAEATLMGRYRR
jgi:Raf kinase inhibitor-like YbhB/YbcL family protein